MTDLASNIPTKVVVAWKAVNTALRAVEQTDTISEAADQLPYGDESSEVWSAEYRELVNAEVRDNVTSRTAIGHDELLGEGQYSTAMTQVMLPQLTFTQDTDLTMKALRKVPDAKNREPSFAVVKQGPQEPYMSFID
ncbi:hypothetical protein BTVI_45969 [Pitangus sulphuratus]|nr:hypothetical protein BTVI_45969 [Pitangus sulphuratus]